MGNRREENGKLFREKTGEKNTRRIHFIGIGGISMNGLAEILHKQGHVISGSDSTATEITRRLEEKGIRVFIGQRGENITDDIDMIVYTAAIKEDNPELAQARAKGIETVTRAELLGLLMRGYRFPISVAGTHGKTTTTSMLAEIFMAAGLDPTVSLGGVLKSIGGTYRIGDSEYCIVESCEYSDSFLQFFPHSAIILNIDNDHLDYFGTMEKIEESFALFAQNIPTDGALIVHEGIQNLDKILAGLTCRIIRYGGETARFKANNPRPWGSGVRFNVLENNAPRGELLLNVPGEHVIQNAMAAYAVADFYGVRHEDIAAGLEPFWGANRRFEKKGEVGGIHIVDDYGHHPTAIKATLHAAKPVCEGKLVCVFQPHNYSRTKELLEEFAAAFDDADVVVVLDIYANREVNPGDIHSSQLVDKLKQRGKEAYYCGGFDEAKNFLFDVCIPKDMLITMGAGDVYLLGETMLHTDLSTLSTDLTAPQ